MSRGPSLAWYIFFSSANATLLTGVELDVREPLQPLAALSRRGGKRSRLYELIKVPLPATLDCKAAHSRLSWRLYQRENVQALVSAHHPPRRASTARTDGGLYNRAQQMGEITSSSRQGRKISAARDRRGGPGGAATSGQLDVLRSRAPHRRGHFPRMSGA